MSGVLHDARVVIVREVALGVVHHILEDQSEPNHIIDLRLLPREVDALGVVRSLDVEDARVQSNVLVITDEQTVGTC